MLTFRDKFHRADDFECIIHADKPPTEHRRFKIAKPILEVWGTPSIAEIATPVQIAAHKRSNAVDFRFIGIESTQFAVFLSPYRVMPGMVLARGPTFSAPVKSMFA